MPKFNPYTMQGNQIASLSLLLRSRISWKMVGMF